MVRYPQSKVTKRQESDKLTDFKSNTPIILGQRNLNHVELQVIIYLQSFGMIPAVNVQRPLNDLASGHPFLRQLKSHRGCKGQDVVSLMTSTRNRRGVSHA